MTWLWLCVYCDRISSEIIISLHHRQFRWIVPMIFDTIIDKFPFNRNLHTPYNPQWLFQLIIYFLISYLYSRVVWWCNGYHSRLIAPGSLIQSRACVLSVSHVLSMTHMGFLLFFWSLCLIYCSVFFPPGHLDKRRSSCFLSASLNQSKSTEQAGRVECISIIL